MSQYCQWPAMAHGVVCMRPIVDTVSRTTKARAVITKEVCETHLPRALKLGWKQSPDQAIRDITNQIISWLEALPNDKLQAVIDTPTQVTNTNCWYMTYHLADGLGIIATDIMRPRHQRARQTFLSWFAAHFNAAAVARRLMSRP